MIAVPNALKTGTAAGPSASTPATAVMGQGYLILALRTADGQPLTSRSSGGSGTGALVAPKLGSVVVAIPATSEADFATQALAATFYLALSTPGTSP